MIEEVNENHNFIPEEQNDIVDDEIFPEYSEFKRIFDENADIYKIDEREESLFTLFSDHFRVITKKESVIIEMYNEIDFSEKLNWRECLSIGIWYIFIHFKWSSIANISETMSEDFPSLFFKLLIISFDFYAFNDERYKNSPFWTFTKNEGFYLNSIEDPLKQIIVFSVNSITEYIHDINSRYDDDISGVLEKISFSLYNNEGVEFIVGPDKLSGFAEKDKYEKMKNQLIEKMEKDKVQRKAIEKALFKSKDTEKKIKELRKNRKEIRQSMIIKAADREFFKKTLKNNEVDIDVKDFMKNKAAEIVKIDKEIERLKNESKEVVKKDEDVKKDIDEKKVVNEDKAKNLKKFKNFEKKYEKDNEINDKIIEKYSKLENEDVASLVKKANNQVKNIITNVKKNDIPKKDEQDKSKKKEVDKVIKPDKTEGLGLHEKITKNKDESKLLKKGGELKRETDNRILYIGNELNNQDNNQINKVIENNQINEVIKNNEVIENNQIVENQNIQTNKITSKKDKSNIYEKDELSLNEAPIKIDKDKIISSNINIKKKKDIEGKRVKISDIVRDKNIEIINNNQVDEVMDVKQDDEINDTRKLISIIDQADKNNNQVIKRIKKKIKVDVSNMNKDNKSRRFKNEDKKMIKDAIELVDIEKLKKIEKEVALKKEIEMKQMQELEKIKMEELELQRIKDEEINHEKEIIRLLNEKTEIQINENIPIKEQISEKEEMIESKLKTMKDEIIGKRKNKREKIKIRKEKKEKRKYDKKIYSDIKTGNVLEDYKNAITKVIQDSTIKIDEIHENDGLSNIFNDINVDTNSRLNFIDDDFPFNNNIEQQIISKPLIDPIYLGPNITHMENEIKIMEKNVKKEMVKDAIKKIKKLKKNLSLNIKPVVELPLNQLKNKRKAIKAYEKIKNLRINEKSFNETIKVIKKDLADGIKNNDLSKVSYNLIKFKKKLEIQALKYKLKKKDKDKEFLEHEKVYNDTKKIIEQNDNEVDEGMRLFKPIFEDMRQHKNNLKNFKILRGVIEKLKNKIDFNIDNLSSTPHERVLTLCQIHFMTKKIIEFNLLFSEEINAEIDNYNYGNKIDTHIDSDFDVVMDDILPQAQQESEKILHKITISVNLSVIETMYNDFLKIKDKFKDFEILILLEYFDSKILELKGQNIETINIDKIEFDDEAAKKVALNKYTLDIENKLNDARMIFKRKKLDELQSELEKRLNKKWRFNNVPNYINKVLDKLANDFDIDTNIEKYDLVINKIQKFENQLIIINNLISKVNRMIIAKKKLNDDERNNIFEYLTNEKNKIQDLIDNIFFNDNVDIIESNYITEIYELIKGKDVFSESDFKSKMTERVGIYKKPIINQLGKKRKEIKENEIEKESFNLIEKVGEQDELRKDVLGLIEDGDKYKNEQEKNEEKQVEEEKNEKQVIEENAIKLNEEKLNQVNENVIEDFKKDILDTIKNKVKKSKVKNDDKKGKKKKERKLVKFIKGTTGYKKKDKFDQSEYPYNEETPIEIHQREMGEVDNYLNEHFFNDGKKYFDPKEKPDFKNMSVEEQDSYEVMRDAKYPIDYFDDYKGTKDFHFEGDDGKTYVIYDENDNKNNKIDIKKFSKFGSWVDLPENYRNLRCIFNPKPSKLLENNCFITCVLAALNQVQNERSINSILKNAIYSNISQIENIQEFLGVIDFNQVSEFSKKNKINIVLWQLLENNILIPNFKIFNASDSHKKVHLLIYRNHLTLITDPAALFKFYKKQNSTYHACIYCNCVSFRSEKYLKRHMQICNAKKIAGYSLVEPGACMTFKNCKNSNAKKFIVYADIESILDNSNRVFKTDTMKLDNKHIPIAVGFFTVGFSESSKYSYYYGKDCIEKFIDWINFKTVEVKKYSEKGYIKKDFVKNLVCNCFLCDEKMNEGFIIKNHNPFFPLDSHIHENCFNSYKFYNEMTIIFHNLKGYDSHFLIDKFAEKSKSFRAIPKTKEKYTFFSGNIDNVTIKFIDSFGFLAFSLEKLAENLDPSKYLFIKSQFLGVDMSFLGKKLAFPYEYISSEEVLDEETLPLDVKKWNSCLKVPKIEEIKNAIELFNKLKCKSIKEYMLFYLKVDVILLAEIFENFRLSSLKSYKLDPCYYYTTPGLAWDAALRFNKNKDPDFKLQLLDSDELVSFFTQPGVIRGGISTVGSLRYAESNSDYEIKYFDVTNLYGYAMTFKLPYSDFEFLETEHLTETCIKLLETWNLDDEYGYIFEVDVQQSTKEHDFFNDLPLFTESTNSKLIPNFKRKYQYKTHICILQQAFRFSAIGYLKVIRILKFKQRAWLKEYVENNTELRNKSKGSDKEFYKLMNNSVYGKTMENVLKRSKITFYNKKDHNKMIKDFNKFKINNYKSFTTNLYIAEQNVVHEFSKPVYAGFAILEYSKMHMYNLYYKILKKNIQECRLIYMDTDSFIVRLKGKINEENQDVKDWILSSKNNKLGSLKDECPNEKILRVYAIRPKTYMLIFEGNLRNWFFKTKYKIRNKGYNNRDIYEDDFRNALSCENSFVLKKDLFTIRSFNHVVSTVSLKKIVLSNKRDTKRVINRFNTNETFAIGNEQIYKTHLPLAIKKIDKVLLKLNLVKVFNKIRIKNI